jgi:hypothetical protein
MDLDSLISWKVFLFYPTCLRSVLMHLGGEGPQIKALPPRMQQIEYRYSQISISRISVLGDRLFDAVQASAQWRQERKTGGFTTDCLIALIPRSENEDISIILSVGHEKGLELINQLQPEEGSEMDQPTIEHVQMERLIGMQTEKGKQRVSLCLTYLLTISAIEIEYKCSHIAISRMSVLGDLLFDAVQASARWKQERKCGGSTTDCLIALIPRSQNVDISINVSIGHEEGLKLINQLQLEPI